MASKRRFGWVRKLRSGRYQNLMRAAALSRSPGRSFRKHAGGYQRMFA
jgi:hypothetical protein